MIDRSTHPERPSAVASGEAPRTAAHIHEARLQLVDWNDDDLGLVSLLPIGARLDEGALYVDLRDPARREFTGTAEMRVPPDGLYVPKAAVEPRIWARILGVRTAERLTHP